MKYTRSDFPAGFLFGTGAPAPIMAGPDCYRLRLEWAHILPDGRNPDPKALDTCERQIDQMLHRGLRPCITLDHTTLPAPLADIGGWRNRDIAPRFADFAEAVVARMGARLFSIAHGGRTPIHDTGQRGTARSLHHQYLAHGQAVQAMRSYGMTNIGAELGRADPAELEAVITGHYPAAILERLGDGLPRTWQQDLSTIAEPVDWYGLSAEAAQALEVVHGYTKDRSLFMTLPADDVTGLDAVQQALKHHIPMQGLFLEVDRPELPTFLSEPPCPAPWVQPERHLHAHWNLVADIGGTNTRLGVVTNGELTDLRKHPTGTLAELRAALHDLRDEIGTDPRAVVAAGAGPVRDGAIQLTNANLVLSEDELGRVTGARHTFVINDFTAAAWSVAEISGDQVEVLQGKATPPMGTRLVVGPGTGLGVGALLYSEGHFHTVSGEGGHMGLSPRHLDEVAVFDAARRLAPEYFFDDSLVLEAEMFLSGTGLPILYQAVAMAAGQPPAVRPAKDILQDAQDGTDPCAVRSARIFTEHLGAIMGDLAVALVPTGGVFLVGGVAEKNRWLFGQDFLRAFNAGGRFDALRQGMNLYVSEQDEFGIVGANNFCKNALAR